MMKVLSCILVCGGKRGNIARNAQPSREVFFKNKYRRFCSEKSSLELTPLQKDPAVLSRLGSAVSFQVRLPSKNEQCLFTLKPFSNTLDDLYSMMAREDGGVERISVYNGSGVRLAKSTPVSRLVGEPFRLVINDLQFRAELPSSEGDGGMVFHEEEEYSKMKEHVYEVSHALLASENRSAQEETLRNEIQSLREQLKPLRSSKDMLITEVSRKCDRITWLGLGLMGFQFGFLARLTWWEYSWDIMEPVTYFVTYGTAAAMYGYYTLTKQDYVFPDVRKRLFWLNMYRKAESGAVDTEKLEALELELKRKESKAAVKYEKTF